MKVVAGFAVLAMLAAASPAYAEQAARDLIDMSLEELGAVRVISVARRETRLDESASSIYVITAEDIRRSGATTLPEVLRLAPNLQVARRSSVEYAISARGFNNAVGNKLLVLIDGRTVYTPVFSGVFWEMQDTMLEDIERIEVISGPRAVRSPARYDRDVFFPQDPPHIVAGGPNFQSEIARVFELGLRAQPTPMVSISLTAFRHEWDRLRSGTPLPLPIMLVNNIEGTVTGVEGWANWQVLPRWRLSAGFLTQSKDLAFRRGSEEDTAGVDNPTLHNDPDYQWMLRSRSDLGSRLELDLYLRGVDELTVEPVPSYIELDVRLGWRISPAWNLTLTGRNLLDRSHGEFGAAERRSEFERFAMLRTEWRY